MRSSATAVIMPFLTVSDAQKAVEFYESGFGANILERHEMADSKLSYKIAIAGALICVGDEEPQFGNFSPAASFPNPVRIILQTPDADAVFEGALRHGAVEICPMTTEDDWRIGKLADPFGHIWEIGYELDSPANS